MRCPDRTPSSNGSKARGCARSSTRSRRTKEQAFLAQYRDEIAIAYPHARRWTRAAAVSAPLHRGVAAMKPPRRMVSDPLTLAAQDRADEREERAACRHISVARSRRLFLSSAMSGAALRAGPGKPHACRAAAARQSRRSQASRQGGVWPRADADGSAVALDRLLRARLSRRRQGAACRWRDMAGDAPVARSQLGQSGDDLLPRALFEEGGARRASGPAFWSAISRNRAAARC